MRNRIISVVFLILFIFGCQKEFDLKLDFSPNVTLNCILDPDSTLKVKISNTKRIGDYSDFLPVNNGSVKIMEGETIHELEMVNDGIYETDYLPAPGKTYQLKAEIPNHATLFAETTIPSIPVASVIRNQGDFTYTVSITDNPNEKNIYWIYALSGRYQPVYMSPPRKVYDKSVFGIWTNSVAADGFNREKDNAMQLMDYVHSYGMRIPDMNFTKSRVVFDIKISDGWNELERIIIVSADENLDNYLKTGLLQRDQKAGGETPVFLIPISMFTNIENGKGIFGSCSIVAFDFE